MQSKFLLNEHQLLRCEGLVPLPKSSHTIRCAVDEAVRAREVGEAKSILFNLSGHGFFDMTAYDSYLAGGLEDHAYPEAKLRDSLANLQRLE